MKVSLRTLAIDDLQTLEQWYEQINGATYTSRYGPKNFNGIDTSISEEYIWYMIKANETDCGVIWLEKGEKNNDIAILGIMIGKEDYFGKGIGKEAISLAINQSRKELNFSKVCLNVRKTNIRAIRCYTKYGFCISGEGEKIVNEEQKIEFFSMILDVEKVQSEVFL